MSLINIDQYNRSAGTAKPTSENHESSTGTVNTHSLYTINENNDNIEHGNTHRLVTPHGVYPSQNSASNNIK